MAILTIFGGSSVKIYFFQLNYTWNTSTRIEDQFQSWKPTITYQSLFVSIKLHAGYFDTCRRPISVSNAYNNL